MKKIIRLVIIVLAIYLLFLGSGYILKNVIFPLKYMNYVEKYSKEYNLDPYFVMAVMKAESNFDEDAKSNKDARGLMQITTSTGKWIAEKQGIIDFDTNLLLEPEVNIRFGCWYLNNLHKEFGDWDLVIATYNAEEDGFKNGLIVLNILMMEKILLIYHLKKLINMLKSKCLLQYI